VLRPLPAHAEDGFERKALARMTYLASVFAVALGTGNGAIAADVVAAATDFIEQLKAAAPARRLDGFGQGVEGDHDARWIVFVFLADALAYTTEVFTLHLDLRELFERKPK
jgi:hypothetical protein